MSKIQPEKEVNFEKDFAIRLNKLTAELKQESIANATHLSRQSISNYVRGKRIPDAKFIWDFLHEVNNEYTEMGYGEINANYLFGISDSMLCEDFKIENVCKFSNETILNLKNISKSHSKLKALNILLQNKNLADFLDELYDYIFHRDYKLNQKLDKKTNNELLEFNLSKLTNKFISNMAKDIIQNDYIIQKYEDLLEHIDICKKYLNGNADTIKFSNPLNKVSYTVIFEKEGLEGIQTRLTHYEDELERFRKGELKNLKRIYEDRYKIKEDSSY